jgi:hypothetical protein
MTAETYKKELTMKRNKKTARAMLFVCVVGLAGLLASCSNPTDGKDGVDGKDGIYMDAIPAEAGLRGNTFVDSSAAGSTTKTFVFSGDGKTFTSESADGSRKWTYYVISCIKAPAGYSYPDGDSRTTWVIQEEYIQTVGSSGINSRKYIFHVGTSDLKYGTTAYIKL